MMEGYNYSNLPRQQNESSAAGDSVHKYGHVVQSRSVQRSHALPRSSSRSKSRSKSRCGSSSGSNIGARSSSRGKMHSPPPHPPPPAPGNLTPHSFSELTKGSIKRDGKIDERGRCRRHPNIELCRREATNGNTPPSWRVLLQDCPLCSFNDSGLNRSNDANILSGEATTQTGETSTTSWPSSGEDTSVDSVTSNNIGIVKTEKIGLSATTKQAPPPQRKRSSVQTLKALGKMHMEGDDAASASARSTASRRSRQPPPPPPAGRSPHSTSNTSPPLTKDSTTSLSSLSTKELSRLRKERYSSEGINESFAEIRKQQNAESAVSSQHDVGYSLERLRSERNDAKDKLMRKRESNETFTLPMNDVRRGRVAAARDNDILGAAAEIRARAQRSLSRSRERRKAADDLLGTSSTLGDEQAGNGDALSVASRGRRSIMNPHGLAEPPEPLPMQRKSQSRERRSRSDGKGVDGGEGLERHRYDANYERSSEVLINRRREMRQRLVERQNAADHRREGSGSADTGDKDYQSLKEGTIDDWNMETRRSVLSKERDDRGRGRSRSRVRDGLSKIRSASLNAFRKKDQKSSDSEDRSVDSGRMSFKRLISNGSRLRSRSRGRCAKSQDHLDVWDTTSATYDVPLSVSEHGFDSQNVTEPDIMVSNEGRRDFRSTLGRISSSKTSIIRQTRHDLFRLEDEFDNLRGLGGDDNYARLFEV